MPYITIGKEHSDDIELSYKDWGSGEPVVFSHGWPLSADAYADDLATLVETLDLKNAIHVGHSTGGGEVARYIGRHGTTRVSKAVLIGAVPPLMLKTAANPGGTPIEAFDQIRAAVLADRARQSDPARAHALGAPAQKHMRFRGPIEQCGDSENA